MRHFNLIKRLPVILACVSLFQYTNAQRSGPLSVSIDSVFAFGDSYTDNGAFDSFYKLKSVQIDENSLHPLTAKTTRASNGPVWVEYLSEMLGSSRLYNFARSGATANNQLLRRNTYDLNQQVSAYAASDASLLPKSRSAFFIWIGVNDINDLFAKYPKRYDTDRILDSVIQTVAKNLDALADGGIQYVMLMGLIPLDILPMYKDLRLRDREDLLTLIDKYNSRLSTTLKRFQMSHPKVKAYFYDIHELFEKWVEENHLKTTDTIGNCTSQEACANALWYDKLHPSTTTHFRIAASIYKTIVDLGW